MPRDASPSSSPSELRGWSHRSGFGEDGNGMDDDNDDDGRLDDNNDDDDGRLDDNDGDDGRLDDNNGDNGLWVYVMIS